MIYIYKIIPFIINAIYSVYTMIKPNPTFIQ